MGTRGVPALYGGFETAVEEIGKRLVARGYDVTVYCRNPGQTITSYEGMTLVNAPALRHRMAETLSHTAASTAHAIVKDHPDVVLLLNAGNAPLLKPLALAGIPTAIHLDGLESKREKWRGHGRDVLPVGGAGVGEVGRGGDRRRAGDRRPRAARCTGAPAS